MGLKLEAEDVELHDGTGEFEVLIKNWKTNYTVKQLAEWIEETYGQGYIRCTPLPPGSTKNVKPMLTMSPRPVSTRKLKIKVKKKRESE